MCFILYVPGVKPVLTQKKCKELVWSVHLGRSQRVKIVHAWRSVVHYVLWRKCSWNEKKMRWSVHFCNQLFHAGVLAFCKEQLRFSFTSPTSWISPKLQEKKEKQTTLSLLCFKLLLFPLKSFMASLVFFPLTANFYLNFGAVVTFSYSEGRRPSHCTQVTQCMWGFAIWIQFSLPPVINAVWILGGHGSKK